MYLVVKYYIQLYSSKKKFDSSINKEKIQKRKAHAITIQNHAQIFSIIKVSKQKEFFSKKFKKTFSIRSHTSTQALIIKHALMTEKIVPFVSHKIVTDSDRPVICTRSLGGGSVSGTWRSSAA